MMGSFMSRGNQYIQLVKVLYCKLLTIGTSFPLEVGLGFELRSQRWEARVLQPSQYMWRLAYFGGYSHKEITFKNTNCF